MDEKCDRRDRRGPPPGLTEEERRKWWGRQRRKFVWGPGDIVIAGRGKDSEEPEGEDDESANPGR